MSRRLSFISRPLRNRLFIDKPREGHCKDLLPHRDLTLLPQLKCTGDVFDTILGASHRHLEMALVLDGSFHLSECSSWRSSAK